MSKINPLKKEKLLKREELLKKGVNPYPHSWKKERTSSSLILKDFAHLKAGEVGGKSFFIAGRIMRKRPMGKAAFFNIQDEEGEIQCYIKKEDFKEEEGLNFFQVFKLSDIGDIVGLKGEVFKTKKEEVSLRVSEFTILCKSLESLPEKYHGIEDKEIKYRNRHLDLIMDKSSREVFKTRSQIIKEIRNFMTSKNFMEVETPVLQPVYGGAVARPFETHFHSLKQNMFLKISPEIYLKKLIVGGFEKVFEIGKNFRNEGIDRSHNPEFLMMEWYEAFTDYKDQMEMFEELVCFVTKKVKGSLKFEYQERKINFERPWKRMSVFEACKKYAGVDVKSMSFKELLKAVKSLKLDVDLKKFEKAGKEQEETLRDELILILFEEKAEKNFFDPVFIVDFPLGVSPLTKTHRDNPRLVERFEPYVAGMELGNAYTELNDPVDQRKRLEAQSRWSSEEDTPPLDENFLQALEMGMPPTGGVGLGIERLVMILCDKSSIKDTLLFPFLKNKD